MSARRAVEQALRGCWATAADYLCREWGARHHAGSLQGKAPESQHERIHSLRRRQMRDIAELRFDSLVHHAGRTEEE